jgi:hypothetical protein
VTIAVVQQAVANAHGEGKMLRFWNLPQDAPSVWKPLWEANVDLIHTDDLTCLATSIAPQDHRTNVGTWDVLKGGRGVLIVSSPGSNAKLA